MEEFARLFRELDASTSSLSKQEALQRYLRAAPADDAAWAVYFLAGGKPRQLVPTSVLRILAPQQAGLPLWLFEESYETVGDLAETISLLLPPPQVAVQRSLSEWMSEHLLPLRGMARDKLEARLIEQWQQLAVDQRLVYFKLITGSFRVGVSRLQVTQALAAISGLDAKLIAQRLMGRMHIDHRPSAQDMAALLAPEDAALFTQGTATQDTRPYPFFLAHPLVEPSSQFDELIGPTSHWLAEWKWDGIRAQVVKRGGMTAVWSRGEELITDRFPELVVMSQDWPDGTVIDGEILIATRDLPDQPDAVQVRPFSDLQRRTGRKTLSPKMLKELPALFMAFDVLEVDGVDIRAQSQQSRRQSLESWCARHPHPSLALSPLVSAMSWADLSAYRQESRQRRAEGLMLKHRDARYGVGRTRSDGVWWKWKLDPMSVDAVLIYAQRGHGRRASLYSDYTFAVWNAPAGTPDRTLVPFAKAYSGLTDEEMKRVDAIIRKTTKESFGPVRSVTPTLVFELGFEGISHSPRHKSGIAVRFPRMLRWREDKTVEDADTLQALHQLLALHP